MCLFFPTKIKAFQMWMHLHSSHAKCWLLGVSKGLWITSTVAVEGILYVWLIVMVFVHTFQFHLLATPYLISVHLGSPKRKSEVKFPVSEASKYNTKIIWLSHQLLIFASIPVKSNTFFFLNSINDGVWWEGGFPRWGPVWYPGKITAFPRL